MEEWAYLRALASPQWLGCNVGMSNVSLALDVLHDVLVALFGTPCITKLCEATVSIPFLQTVSKQVNVALHNRKWKQSTVHSCVCVLRMILRKTKVSPAIVRAVRFLRVVPSAINKILGKQLNALPETDVGRQRVESWIQVLRAKTNNRSELSLRSIVQFFANKVLPELGVRLQAEEGVIRFAAQNMSQEAMQRVVGAQKRHALWLQIFLRDICHICDATVDVNTPKIDTSRNDEDLHRIAKEDLEKLYEVAKRDPFNELFFLMLLTTGMRVGGYVNMKIKHVADLHDNAKWHARSEGKTMEKGGKWFAFQIHDRVRQLLEDWLNKGRNFDSCDFVFPGRDSGCHLSTECMRLRFARMCKKAQLRGKQFHPHALRHCYSHILLEVGNTADVVSKLINHASVATTEKYYLKETAAQTARRANIPWLKQQPLDDPVPAFLNEPSQKRQRTIQHAKEITTQLQNAHENLCKQ